MTCLMRVMIWRKLLTMPENKTKPEKNLVLDVLNRGSKPFDLIGPSMWGHIYQCRESGLFCLVIPIEIVKDPAIRQECFETCKSPLRRAQMAPLIEARQEETVFYIFYELNSEKSFLDIIRYEDSVQRLKAAANVLESLPYWWSCQEGMNRLMPADICFIGNEPWLLPNPSKILRKSRPPLQTLFEVPDRIFYLAPEMFYSDEDHIFSRSVDTYACGIAALQCIFNYTGQKSAEDMLTRLVTGTLWTMPALAPRLPFWSQNLDQVRQFQKTIFTLIEWDPRNRSAVDQKAISKNMHQFSDFLDPLTAAETLRKNGEPQAAFSLLQNALMEETDFRFYFMAAEIAEHDLKDPLEAVEMYNRAIAEKPNEVNALKHQLKLLISDEFQGHVRKEMKSGTVSQRTDEMIFRDFYGIPVKERKELVPAVGSYFNWRGLFQKAADLLYPYMFDGKIFLWWEFELCLSYTESLIGLKRFQEADDFLQNTGKNLGKIQDEKRMLPNKVAVYGRRVTHLKHLLTEQKKQSDQ